MRNPLNNPFQSSVIGRAGSGVQINTVLRNTYILLSLTLFFSAITAGIAILTNASPGAGMTATLLAFGMLFVTQALRNSGFGIVAIFGFTGLLGYGLGPMLNSILQGLSNGPQIVMTTLGLTGAIFLSLSAYVLTTQKNFSFMSGFLFVALVLVCLASLVGVFFPMPMLQLIVSSFMVLLFSGFILYDTSRIIHDGERNYIMATMSLYLNIYNLFVNLLMIITALAGRRD
ncbi:MAG: inner membrane protein yccA [Pseudomonadota bacterium]|jgi:modulator of FtsH protease